MPNNSTFLWITRGPGNLGCSNVVWSVQRPSIESFKQAFRAAILEELGRTRTHPPVVRQANHHRGDLGGRHIKLTQGPNQSPSPRFQEILKKSILAYCTIAKSRQKIFRKFWRHNEMIATALKELERTGRLARGRKGDHKVWVTVPSNEQPESE